MKTSQSQLTERQVDFYTTNEIVRAPLLKPERACIKLTLGERTSSLDIGSWCYTTRGRQSFATGVRPVDINSFLQGRRELVMVFIDKLLTSRWRSSTAKAKAGLIGQLLDWCDHNGHSGLLESLDNARSAYISYSDQLHREIATGNLRPITARIKQSMLEDVLTWSLGADKITTVTRGVAKFSTEKAQIEGPEDSEVAAYTSTLLSLVKTLPKSLMNGAPYPLLVKLPEYSTYIFPARKGNIRTPHSPKPNISYNFDEGRIATAEEVFSSSSIALSACQKAVTKAQENLARSNSDMDCWHRLNLTRDLLGAYASLFLVITGANPAPFVGLEYQDALNFMGSESRGDLSTIKFRAQGKTIRLPIGSKQGRRILKEYLEFRKWVLRGEEFPYLFFQLADFNRGIERGKPVQLEGSFQPKFFQKVIKGRFLPSTARNVSSVLTRKYKSVVLHELKVDPRTTADLLQHSHTVNAQHYSDNSASKSRSEMELWWKAVSAAAKHVKTSKESTDKATTTGHCDDFGSPKKIASDTPIEPSCTSQHGCLFCAHYSCHADKKDTEKLLSLQYVMEMVREQAENPGHADRLLKELNIRINIIIDAIANTSEEAVQIVKSARRRVHDLGELTPFWEARLSRYERLGVIF